MAPDYVRRLGSSHGVISEEEFYAKVPQGHRARSQETAFLLKVQSSRAFLRLLGLLSKQSGLPVDELQISTQELVRCCWNEADKVLLDSQQRFVIKAENAQLRKKLNACNQAALKQVSVLRYGTAPPSGDYGMETVEFYEPLQYLEPDTRELVLELVVEKLRQIEMGNLPPSLVEALAERARAGPLIAGGSTQAEQLKNAIEQLHDALEDLKEMRAQLADAEEMNKKLREQKEDATDSQRELEQLRAECDVQRETHAAELARLTDEHNKALEDHGKLSVEVGESTSAVNGDMKAARIGVQESKATQTTFDMKSFLGEEDKDTEIRKRTAMLEELQMKMKESFQVMRKKGCEVQVTETIDEMGLKEVISKRTVFERLHEEAAKRAARLERLRSSVLAAREKVANMIKTDAQTVNQMLDPEKPEKADKDEVPVLRAVEQSTLGGLQKLYQDMALREAGSGGVNSSNAFCTRQTAGLVLEAAPRPPSPPKPSRPPQPNDSFWMVHGVSQHARRAPARPPRVKSIASSPNLGLSEPQNPSLRRHASLATISRDVHKFSGADASLASGHVICSPPVKSVRAGIERLDAVTAPLDRAIDLYSSASPGGCRIRRPRRLLI